VLHGPYELNPEQALAGNTFAATNLDKSVIESIANETKLHPTSVQTVVGEGALEFKMVNLTKEATIHLKNVSQIDETIIDEPTSRGVDNIWLLNY